MAVAIVECAEMRATFGPSASCRDASPTKIPDRESYFAALSSAARTTATPYSVRTTEDYADRGRNRTITKMCYGNYTDLFVFKARGFEFIRCAYFKLELCVA